MMERATSEKKLEGDGRMCTANNDAFLYPLWLTMNEHGAGVLNN
jgi:hypothetical protein